MAKCAATDASERCVCQRHPRLARCAANRTSAHTRPIVYETLPCGHAINCPFVNPKHRCAADDGASDAARGSPGCWEQMRPPLVPASACPSRPWDSARFARALGPRALIFIGDSLAAQQWRALMCLEEAHLAASTHAAVRRAAAENIPRGETCAALVGGAHSIGARSCIVRATDLSSVLRVASRYASVGNALLVLSAYAHGAAGGGASNSSSEAAHLARVLAWHKAQGDRLTARVVWRTREADHYGPSGWTGTRERRGCSPLTAEQRAALRRPLSELELSAASGSGVWLLDGGVATADAYRAHPAHCGGAGGGWVDCRHFCQPGIFEHWNRQLVELMISKLPPGGWLAASKT